MQHGHRPLEGGLHLRVARGGKRDLAEAAGSRLTFVSRSETRLQCQAKRAERKPEGLDGLAPRAHHAAVAVEGAEPLGELKGVGRDPVRRSLLGGAPELERKRKQELDERALGGVQRLARLFAQGSHCVLAALRCRPGEHRGDARVGVLDVVDGVLVALPAGEVEVEVDGRVVRAGEQVPARRVAADLAEQLVDGDEIAGAL